MKHNLQRPSQRQPKRFLRLSQKQLKRQQGSAKAKPQNLRRLQKLQIARTPGKIRPTGLPEGYELAGKMPRYIGWLINFGWNFGVAIGLLSIISTGADSDLTLGWMHRF